MLVYYISILVAIVIGYLYLRLSQSYLLCSRELRRLESNSRSPIFSQYGETLSGLSTIRAFSAEQRFLDEMFDKIDETQRNHYGMSFFQRFSA